MDGYCVICGNKRKGIGVKDDYVINSIRWFKRTVTKNEKGRKLIVCKECYPDYKKRYDGYRSRQMLYLVLGVAFMIFGLLISTSIGTIIIGVLVILALFALSLLSYVPSLNVAAKSKTG